MTQLIGLDETESPRRAPTATILDGFARSSSEHAEKVALVVGEEATSYADLARHATTMAATLDIISNDGDAPGLTGVFGHRSTSGFAGVLAALHRGHGFVPLKRTFPPARTAVMINRSGCRSVIVDAESAPQLPEVLAEVDTDLTILLADADEVGDLLTAWPRHRFISRAELAPGEGYRGRRPAPEEIAYVLFTSGSTGIPKGVGVTHANVCHFIGSVVDRYGVTSSDRLSQTFDLTFDLSVFDMFVAWDRGASLHCLTGNTLIKPGGYIREHELTMWFSVPSMAILMKQFGELKPGSFPSLRWSLFCGEALPADIADTWQHAAPGSVVENLYGPTEVTIATTVHRWDGDAAVENGVVPIGEPLPGMSTVVVDDQLREVGDGHAGELLLAGPQVTPGYLNDPEKTAAAFVVPPGQSTVHYRTGDRVRRVGDGPLRYLGRMDSQMKISGHRVELGEIEAAIRDATGVNAVVVVGWPRTVGGASAVEAFIAGEFDLVSLRDGLAARLPKYMVPRRIHRIETIPLNDNGKYDRKALLAMLDARATEEKA